jgi:hypothetical protein
VDPNPQTNSTKGELRESRGAAQLLDDNREGSCVSRQQVVLGAAPPGMPGVLAQITSSMRLRRTRRCIFACEFGTRHVKNARLFERKTPDTRSGARFCREAQKGSLLSLGSYANLRDSRGSHRVYLTPRGEMFVNLKLESSISIMTTLLDSFCKYF